MKLLLKLEEELSVPLLSGAAVWWCSSADPSMWGWTNTAFSGTKSDSMMPIWWNSPLLSGLWAVSLWNLFQLIQAAMTIHLVQWSAFSSAFFWIWSNLIYLWCYLWLSISSEVVWEWTKSAFWLGRNSGSSEVGFHGFLLAIFLIMQRAWGHVVVFLGLWWQMSFVLKYLESHLLFVCVLIFKVSSNPRNLCKNWFVFSPHKLCYLWCNNL